MGQDIIIMIMH